MSLPPKISSTSLPLISGLPGIPFVGCIGGDASAYFGNQFNGLPGLQALSVIRAVKKTLEETIYTLLKGQLPDPVRPAPYAARMAELIDQVAQIVAVGNEIISGLAGEINGAITYVNGRIGELNGLISDLNAVPEGTRNVVQQAMIENYNRYLGQLEAQVTRLEATLGCLEAL